MARELSALERSTFEMLTAQYPKAVIAPHVLRSETTINNTDSILTFPILEDSITPLKTEIRLNKNDVMYVTGLGLFLYPKVAGAEGKAPLETYPNQTVFVAATGFVPTDLETIYSSKLRLQVGSLEYLPGLDCSKFRCVPQTQQSAGTNRSQSDEDSGFINLPVFYKLRGNDQISLTLSIAMFTGIQMAAVAANTSNQVVLKARGFLIKGIANLG